MPISVQNLPLSHFISLKQQKTLDVGPQIQRRSVWLPKSRMLFIDSLARRVPVNAVTLYKDESQGFAVWEVIDGKQRLETFLSYVDDEFAVDQKVIEAADEDELSDVGLEMAEPLYGKKFSQLDQKTSNLLLQYTLPVFEVTGERDQAVQAFTRMNQHSYVLKPQEIRNAVYAKSHFLKVVKELDTDFAQFFSGEDGAGMLALGITSEAGVARMQDLQFYSELLCLALDGEQHRRDTLNGYYDMYRSPGSAAKKKLKTAKDDVLAALKQISEIFEQSPLQAFHFPAAGTCENDVYAIVGALLSRGLFSQPQMANLQPAIQSALSEFRRQANLYVASSRGQDVDYDNDTAPDAVGKYAQTLLGGQQNSQKKRKERREALVELLDGVCEPPSKEQFSPAIRQLIWSRSSDKLCGRCQKKVAFEEFHAGHVKAAALGGTSNVKNGRVEHAKCNLSAGAT